MALRPLPTSQARVSARGDASDELGQSFVREAECPRPSLRPGQGASEVLRRRALDEACKAGRLDEALSHAEWLMARYAEAGAPAAVCETFHAVRKLGVPRRFSAQALWLAVVAGNSCADAALVVEATRELLRAHPTSPRLPLAMLVTARHQLAEGRTELARATLEHLIEHYPQSPAARSGRSMLAHFTALSTFGTHE